MWCGRYVDAEMFSAWSKEEARGGDGGGGVAYGEVGQVRGGKARNHQLWPAVVATPAGLLCGVDEGEEVARGTGVKGGEPGSGEWELE